MKRLVDCWYGRCVRRFLLAPLSLVFLLVTALRRALYRSGWLRAERLPVPVVVVGNITVGGTGKTPLVLCLVETLRQAGLRPGIVTRGYGGRQGVPKEVSPDSDPAEVGDEPVLLARRAGCPVWAGRRRAQVAGRLLAAHPEVDVVLSDDGLQHYALARDVEIVVVDGARGFGNGWPLPAGPLREPVSRLRAVDAVVVNGAWAGGELSAPVYAMRLEAKGFWNLGDPGHRVEVGHFAARPLHALAGIGNPGRFFAQLRALGLAPTEHAFPDHHAFRREEMPEGTLVMTEKDAVKCAPFGLADAWALQVDAVVPPELKTRVLNGIGHPHGPEAS